MKIKEHLPEIILITSISLIVAFAALSHNTMSEEYKHTCVKVGGTPVFNGQFYECWGVVSGNVNDLI